MQMQQKCGPRVMMLLLAGRRHRRLHMPAELLQIVFDEFVPVM